jgi:hypothetical protein
LVNLVQRAHLVEERPIKIRIAAQRGHEDRGFPKQKQRLKGVLCIIGRGDLDAFGEKRTMLVSIAPPATPNSPKFINLREESELSFHTHPFASTGIPARS